MLRTQAGFDIPQAFPVGELCEGQAEELVETGKGFDFINGDRDSVAHNAERCAWADAP